MGCDNAYDNDAEENAAAEAYHKGGCKIGVSYRRHKVVGGGGNMSTVKEAIIKVAHRQELEVLKDQRAVLLFELELLTMRDCPVHIDANAWDTRAEELAWEIEKIDRKLGESND